MSELPEGSAEGAAERALRLMGSVAPPDGMEMRLKAAVARAGERAPGPLWKGYVQRVLRAWETPRWLGSAAAVGLAFVALMAVLHWHAAPRTERTVAHRPAAREGDVARAIPEAKDVDGPRLARVHAPASEGRGMRGSVSRRHTASAQRAVSATEVERPREASFPAPPAPMTEQERLLVVLARRWGGSERPEVASLLISEPVLHHGLAPQVLQLAGESGEKR